MPQWVPIIILGIGNVGRALTRQIVDLRALHAERLRARLEIVALSDSDGAIFQPGGLQDSELDAILRAKAQGARLRDSELGAPLGDLLGLVDVAVDEGAIVVDLTASDATIPALESALDQGYGAVTANKLPLAADLATYRRLTDHRRFRWEATVGAGLPVIATLNNLVLTGDEVIRIEGALSGTLGFLASQLEAGTPFSAAVREAKQRGYTEPDPRQDLGGLDAARKALILGRMSGLPLELSDVVIESLYPADMNSLTVDEFLDALPALDEPYAQRVAEARAAGLTLRYAAEVSAGGARVGFQALPPDHRLARVRSSDSIVIFQTARYNENPLVVSGRGAGAVNTAAGVLGDILSLIA